MQSVPIEVQSLILHHLNPASLNAAFQVCTSWTHTIQQDLFIQGYAQTRTTEVIKTLSQKFFQKLLPCFTPTQLYPLHGKIISWDQVHIITETESNLLNLRIIKLLSSIEWYQEMCRQYKDTAINYWCRYGYNNSLHSELFEDSFEYMALFNLSNNQYFANDHIDTDTNQSLVELQPYKSITNSDLKDPLFNMNMAHVGLLVYNYASLKLAQPEMLDNLIQAIFRRYQITHLKYPNGSMSGYFDLSTVFLRSVLSTLSSQCLETNSDKSHEPYKHLDNYLFNRTFNTLKLCVFNDDKLECLRNWIETTPIIIHDLRLYLKSANTVSLESLKAFRETLRQSPIKSIRIEGEFKDQKVKNLCDEISNTSLN